MSLLWPRLPHTVAHEIFGRVSSLQLDELGAQVSTFHDAQLYAATGGSRAGEPDLVGLRNVIVTAASEHGFPSSRRGVVAFDRQLAPQMIEAMRIAAPEAAREGVWSFLALILCPDVTAWRFAFDNRERWVASDLSRHMFSRLWWQAFLLTESVDGVMDTSLLDALTESDLNQLMERRRIAGVRPLVRMLARSVLDADHDVPRRKLIRDATLRVLRRMAFIDYLSLTPHQLEEDISQVVAQSLAALRAR